MHSSLRGTSTGEPRETRRRSRGRGDGVLLRHQHTVAVSKAAQSFRLRNAPLVNVHVAVVVRVHRREGGLEARRDQQVLQVFIPAVDQKFDNFLV